MLTLSEPWVQWVGYRVSFDFGNRLYIHPWGRMYNLFSSLRKNGGRGGVGGGCAGRESSGYVDSRPRLHEGRLFAGMTDGGGRSRRTGEKGSWGEWFCGTMVLGDGDCF